LTPPPTPWVNMNFTTNALHHEDVNRFGTMTDSSTFHLFVGWRQSSCMWTKPQAELHHIGSRLPMKSSRQMIDTLPWNAPSLLSNMCDCFLVAVSHGGRESVVRIATRCGWTVRGSNPEGGGIFLAHPYRPQNQSSPLHNGNRVFSGGKAVGAWCDQPPSPSARWRMG